MTQETVALLADIGGTHARFALLHADGTYSDTRIFSDTAGDTAADCMTLCRTYLDGLPNGCQVTRAAWAVAGPVTGDDVTITNRGWRFSQSVLQAAFGWRDFYVVNDFAALALALPHLEAGDTITIKPARDVHGQPIDTPAALPLGVIGPGTGLGVAGLVPLRDGSWQVLPTEGGHVALPAVNEAENRLLETLQTRLAPLAAEHVLSGRGLVNLAQAMQPDCPWRTPQEIAAAALGRAVWNDPQARTVPPDARAEAVLTQFCLFLGTVAGDAALTLGARGGLYLAGGILPQLVEILYRSGFAARFIDRYAVRTYLDAIPVRLITHPLPALIGLRSLLNQAETFENMATR